MADNKIELLKKFTRLANNNPNEHEANLAARRACKLLEELNWNLSQQVPPGYRPSPAQEDFFRGGRRAEKSYAQQQAEKQKAEDDARRERERRAREEAQRKADEEWIRKEREYQRRARQNPFYGVDWASINFDEFLSGKTYTFRGQPPRPEDVWVKTNNYTYINARTGVEIRAEEYHHKYSYQAKQRKPYQEAKANREKRVLSCTECRKNVETKYVGNPGKFVCNKCVWDIYQRTKGEATSGRETP